MIKIQMRMNSLTLYRPVVLSVALPYSLSSGIDLKKVLYLLHPAMENGDFFFDKLGLLDKVDRHGVVIVAPDLGNGYFINTPYEKQADFLQMELMPVMNEMLRLSSRREDNMLLGISMGAFGAAQWALSCTERFNKVALISGVFDASLPVDERARKNRAQRPLVKLFSEKIMPLLMQNGRGDISPEADIRFLYAKAAEKGAPCFALWHGDEDYLSINQSENFVSQCKRHGINAERHISAGAHNLQYWQDTMGEVFDWLMMKN